MVLRLANAQVLPFDFAPWQKTVSGYLKEVMETADNLRKEVEKHNKLVSRNAYTLAADPTKPFSKPEEKPKVPYLDFSPLQNALASLGEQTEGLKAKDFASFSKAGKQRLNELLMHAEQQLTDPDGLPRRSWYKHQIYAPGFYTGYGVKTLPGVREAIEQKNWQEAQQQIGQLAETLNSMSQYLENIANVQP